MTEKFKISSLHDDLAVPYQERNIPDYDKNKEYPDRLDSLGENGEFSSVRIIKQFGITEQDFINAGVKNLSKISEKQYFGLLENAVKEQYDTIFASVYAEWEEMENQESQIKLIQQVARQYENWDVNKIITSSSVNEQKTNLVLSLEGGDVIHSLGDIDMLHQLGVRSITLQYGNENQLAGLDGLTPLGKQSIDKLIDLNIVIDIAHALPKVRTQILDIVKDKNAGHLLAYTHGSGLYDIAIDHDFNFAAEKRGITEEEFETIIKMGGIVGLGVTRPFFQSVLHIAERIDSICQIDNGPRRVGIGSDFGGVPLHWGIGIRNPADMIRLGDVLSHQFGFDDIAIKNILQKNIPDWTKKALSS